MRLVKLILLSLLLALPAHAVRDHRPGEGILRLRPVSGGRFLVEACSARKPCSVLGEKSGYTREQLKQWLNYKSSVASVVALVGGAGLVAVVAVMGGVLSLPVTGGLSLLAIGGVLGGFYTSSSVRAGVTNDIAAELSARPNVQKSLESLLRQLDSGVPISDNPKILGDTRPVKAEVPVAVNGEPEDESLPAIPAG